METTGGSVPERWYEQAFDVLYPVVYAHRTLESAAPEAAFAARRLSLHEETSLLDLCCGTGRHLAHLALTVRRAAGLDFSFPLLALARAHVPRHVRLVRGDMRLLPFGTEFDAVTNFFTSFGYFLEDAANQSVLMEIGRVLRPTGAYLIDYLNPASVRAGLVPHSTRESEGYSIVEHRWIDERLNRVNKETQVLRNDQPVTSAAESVRLYELSEMAAMLRRAGLEVDDVFGDYDGSRVGAISPRMIFVGHKR